MASKYYHYEKIMNAKKHLTNNKMKMPDKMALDIRELINEKGTRVRREEIINIGKSDMKFFRRILKLTILELREKSSIYIFAITKKDLIFHIAGKLVYQAHAVNFLEI